MTPDTFNPGTGQRVCPLCGADEPTRLFDKGCLRVVRCGRCGMSYANPVAPELASGQFYDRLAAGFYLSPDKLEGDYAPVRFARERKLFRAFCPAGAVLDVGCSTGGFLFQLRSRWPADYRVMGMDVAGAALDYAEGRGLAVARGSFLEHDFGAARFDAVTFWAVLEHLVEPRKFLHRAAGLLRPGGYCFVLVPNLNSLAVRLLGARYRYVMPDHVNYFTAATLRAFGDTEPALERVFLGATHFNPVVIAQDLRRADERVPDAERARLLRRTTALKQQPLLRPLRWAYAGVERGLGWLGLADNLVAVFRRR